ncbi:hypothetical protein H2203_008316 [Taxawa tesnikishii (nom. ined.)]|nr:hypothetical protein H2203_008316 [Dothideales sp. JES 119]
MPDSTKTTLQAAIARFLNQERAGRFSDPVMKVLFQRLRSHVFSRVSASSSIERVRAASTAGETLAMAGFPEFVARVGEVVECLRRVAEVDWRAHGVWYEQVAAEVQGLGRKWRVEAGDGVVEPAGVGGGIGGASRTGIEICGM